MLKTEELKLLNDRVQFEKGIVSQALEAPVRVKLATDRNSAQFFHGSDVLLAKIERPIIHQLGARLWGIQDFAQINNSWQSMAANQLEQELGALFQRHDLVARHYRDEQGANRVYGFVSPSFVEVNPLDFRQQFLEQIQQTTALSPRSNGLTMSKTGDVVEWFDFHSAGFQTKFRYGLHYARNSGYDAYKVHWERLILICTNGLTRWIGGSVSRWKHTRELAMSDFIDATINDGVGHQQWLEQRIEAAKDTQLAEDVFSELMARLSLATATKERVMNRLEVEAKSVGGNEWALSQALTWLGSHDRHIGHWTKTQLTSLGTEILENSLPQVLAGESLIQGNGMYGMVLPERLNTVAT